ncbi:ATP-binding protein [Streptacidiphilus neutrinimicus]|uniref:ATP-binding protein n=1 Tax=Streptacidiphilus neutrinimicus TaxID=105420 RepID=UPI000A70AD33|nr:ATP-binding protein [Streptacidiphilus neutrinimicus]
MDREPQRAAGLMAKMATILRTRGMDLRTLPELADDRAYLPQDALDAAERRIPYLFREAEATHPDVAAWTRRVADAGRPGIQGRPGIHHAPSILLIGPTGTGKTYQAYGAVRALLAMGVRLSWRETTSAELHAMMRPRQTGDGEREFELLKRAPLLLLDDLGVGGVTPFTEQVTYRLIDYRYREMLPTIMTSNLPVGPRPMPGDLRDVLGDRVTSRLRQMSTVIPLDGSDRRVAPAAR